MKKLDKMGVIVLMSHLVITLAFIGVYVYTLAVGQQDDTIRTILTVIVGYWFGAMGKDALRKPTVQVKSEDIEQEKKGA